MPTAPHPPLVPSPLRLRPAIWRYAISRTFREFARVGGIDRAAALTFFSVLAVFPAGLAVMAVIGVVGDSEDVRRRLLQLVNAVAPRAVVETANAILTNVTATSSADIALAISVAVALWSSSIYVSAFGRCVNDIYGVMEGRPFWRRKPVQLALTVLLLVAVLILIGVIMSSGPALRAVGSAIGIGDTTLTMWALVRWPIFATALVGMIAILYQGTGNLTRFAFRWTAAGALIAMTVMGVASAGFALYVSRFARYNETFGTFAGVIIFLIWLFLINASLVLGVKLNAELQRGRQLQAGLPAEEHLRITPRDTTLIDRRERSETITREHGILLRHGQQPPPREDSAILRLRGTVARLRRSLRR